MRRSAARVPRLPYTARVRALRLVFALNASLLLAAGTGPGSDPFDIWDDKTVVAALQEAEEALAEEMGAKIPKSPRILLSSREFFEGVVYKSMKKMEAIRGPQDDRALRHQAKILSRSAFGLYEAHNNTVHLMPENFHSFARDTGNEAFTKSPFLKIVLVHELVHTFDYQKWGLEKKRAAEKNPERQKVWHALVEGHAEWVSEKVSERIGLSREFQLFTNASFNPPPGLSPTEQQFAWRASASMRFAYVDGHRFFTGLEASDNKDIANEVFRTPPSSVSFILHPTRYFMPDETAHFPPTVPTMAAIDAALERELPGGKVQDGNWDEQMMKARLVMLPPRTAANTLAKLTKGSARLSAMPPKGKTPPAMAFCSTAQMTDGAAAKELFEAVIESEKLEDKAIAELSGGKAESGRVSGPLRQNSPMPHNRTIRFVGSGKDVVPEYTVIFAAGPFVAECAFIGKKKTDGELEDFITFFRAKLVDAGKPAPAAK